MARWLSKMLSLLALALWAATVVEAFEEQINQEDDNRQRCAGMYSRTTWGGAVDPFILVKFDKYTGPVDPVISLLIFEWKDEEFIGTQPDPTHPKIIICEPQFVKLGYCNATSLGEFVVQPNATDLSSTLIYTKAVHLKDAEPINYSIKKTGYYCVVTAPFQATDYSALVEFRNSYGELPATQIPKLPFYGGITILYALVAVFWGFLYYQHRSDILAVQNYITAILIFLVVEMLMTWGFYDFLNRHGSNLGSKVLLVVVATLNAFRNSFSFFLLLIVCMGYGVVKHTLGRVMLYVRILAIAHFIFGLVYAITSLLVTPETAGPFVLLIILPLAGTLTAFYVWTLNSLNFTLKDLRERKQHAKESMYRKLWWCILISIITLFSFFFFNSFSFASASDPDFVPFHWKTRWFVLDGWMNLVYFADVAFVAYVWRPTANNRRFAMSDEIAQDDDGTFEIANMDIGVPDDFDEDDDYDEDGRQKPSHGTVTNGASVDRSAAAGAEESNIGSSSRPARPPQPIPQSDPLQRATSSATASTSTAPTKKVADLDGDTIFAVDESEEDSDEEDSDEDSDDDDDDEDSDEETGLVKSKK
ncbi:lung seven transmembrane receptor domain-containing protein [Ophiostoma piceae UAMH 11346]|uniref:Lung seven transmembrane receptor domain-containing protein n=1 Tax=Ophiostoma piceae (strain UAMH 11346) TaxID=1262450 RepID=S3BS99_OPHP1|nr:lung seven transmembrane receptor domain-containing protein [Ophiostoma piceae UAMH 11346]